MWSRRSIGRPQPFLVTLWRNPSASLLSSYETPHHLLSSRAVERAPRPIVGDLGRTTDCIPASLPTFVTASCGRDRCLFARAGAVLPSLARLGSWRSSLFLLCLVLLSLFPSSGPFLWSALPYLTAAFPVRSSLSICNLLLTRFKPPGLTRMSRRPDAATVRLSRIP